MKTRGIKRVFTCPRALVGFTYHPKNLVELLTASAHVPNILNILAAAFEMNPKADLNAIAPHLQITIDYIEYNVTEPATNPAPEPAKVPQHEKTVVL